MNAKEERELSALIWAQKLYGRNTTLYRYLKPGDKFVFKEGGSVKIKGKGQWYRNVNLSGKVYGRAFRTGPLTGVIPQCLAEKTDSRPVSC